MPDSPLSARQQEDGSTATTIADAKNPLVKKAVACWQSLRGERKFPTREQLTLRLLAPFLTYSVIVDVIDGGADYEYRYVGDAQRRAFRTYFKGMRVTQIEEAAPELGAILRSAYNAVRATGTPLLVRGPVDHEADPQFGYHETAFLPLGAIDDGVDHLLIVGVHVPSPFWEFSEENWKKLANKVGVPDEVV